MESLMGLLPITILLILVFIVIRRSSNKAHKEGRGHIGGWLLLLIIGLAVLGPMLGFSRLIGEFAYAERQYPQLAQAQIWESFKNATWLCFAFFSGLSIYAGWGLYKGKDMSVVRRAKTLLWIIGPGASVVMGGLMPVFFFGKVEIDPSFAGSLIASVIVTGIWTLYLTKSKRVLAGYAGGPEVIPADTPHTINETPVAEGSWKDKLSAFMATGAGLVVFGGVVIFGMAQLVAGFDGISEGIGKGWAWAAIIAALMFRFTLPITIGSFFGAMNVWGWHWALAALFAVPGLLFVIPGAIGALISVARR
jgi:hypothetical protein